MNVSASLRIARTKAEEAIAASFVAARGALPGKAPVAERREAAFALFQQAGLPTRRVEAWKYTDLRVLMRSAAPLAGPATAKAAKALLKADPLGRLDRARLVIANGVYRPDLSDTGGIDGVTVTSLAEVLAADPDRIGRLFSDGDDALMALNTALMQGGVVVAVEKGADIARPVEIVHLTAADTPVSSYVRNLVEIGAGASATIVESHLGPAGIAYQANPLTELVVGDNARLAWARLQAEGLDAVHVGSFVARIGRDAALTHLSVNSGAALARWQGFVTVAGPGAEIGFHGATMLAGREHGDTALQVKHAMPHGRSREFFKAVVDGDGDGAFQGRIVVDPGAQKTDAKMMTRSLLLSDQAQFAAKPELEIFADDVQCGHGATSGRIDAGQLFYLMARGVPRGEAERLLIEAFLADPIDAIGNEQIAEALKGTIATWLARRARSLEAA